MLKSPALKSHTPDELEDASWTNCSRYLSDILFPFSVRHTSIIPALCSPCLAGDTYILFCNRLRHVYLSIVQSYIGTCRTQFIETGDSVATI